jgi:hypothetical protein
MCAEYENRGQSQLPKRIRDFNMPFGQELLRN